MWGSYNADFISRSLYAQCQSMNPLYAFPPVVLPLPPTANNMFAIGPWPLCIIAEEIVPDQQIQKCDSLLQVAFLQFISGRDFPTSTFQAIGSLKPPTLFDAIKALSSFEAQFNDFCRLALDMTAIGRDDFILAQTAASMRYIGPVARNQPNASYRRLVPDSHLINLARHALYCSRFVPGQVVAFSSKVMVKRET